MCAVMLSKKTSAVKIYAALLAADCLMTFAVAFLLGSRCKNVNYYLYAFPPIRLLDYFSGFVLGRTFVLQQNNKTKISAATYWEVVAVGVMVLYLLLFPYVPVPICTSGKVYQPGAAFVIYVIAAGQERFKIPEQSTYGQAGRRLSVLHDEPPGYHSILLFNS